VSRLRTLWAGLLVLALTNAVALGGAFWNRSGDPDATLHLTQRELSLADSRYGSRENSGLSLHPVWRVLAADDTREQFYFMSYGSGGAPAWLDREKMESLGFVASGFVPHSERARKRYEKQLPREVLLVLELDGPAYRSALELTGERAALVLAKPFLPEDKSAEERRKNARDGLDWERSRSSRLFVVDAGLHVDALRARYPDRERYAIVRGEVKPWIVNPKAERPAGYVSRVSVASINVPLGLRNVFDDARLSEYGPVPKTPLQATVAWGRRLEPWLVEAARK
jgi:hypothetical protein